MSELQCLICGEKKTKKDKDENVYGEFVCSKCELVLATKVPLILTDPDIE